MLLSSEMDQAKNGLSLNAFSANFARPHPYKSPLKIPCHLVQLLTIRILIPKAAMKIHRALGIGKTWCIQVSTALQASSHCSQYRGAFIAPLPIERATCWV
jgi:hypothetical protein